MSKNRIFSLISVLLLVLVPGLSATAQGSDAPGANEAFSIDKLYEIPSLIGTEPGGVDWSGDGQQLAFLWNDKGGTFRDIWLYDTASGEKRQLTRHADGVDDALEHRGIGELRWFGPQAQQLAYTLDGRLHVSSVQGESRALDTGLAGIRQLTVSPDRKHLSFVAETGADSPAHKSVVGQGLWIFDYAPANPGQVRLL
jgi:dipeptidyl-peptidase-4